MSRWIEPSSWIVKTRGTSQWNLEYLMVKQPRPFAILQVTANNSFFPSDITARAIEEHMYLFFSHAARRSSRWWGGQWRCFPLLQIPSLKLQYVTFWATQPNVHINVSYWSVIVSKLRSGRSMCTISMLSVFKLSFCIFYFRYFKLQKSENTNICGYVKYISQRFRWNNDYLHYTCLLCHVN